jgi:protein-S-isoprenylcysteine O-methyltransferase Ste14
MIADAEPSNLPPGRSRRQGLRDLAAVTPLILFYALAAVGLAIGIARRLDGAQLSLELLLWLAAQAALVGFFGLQVALFVMRRGAVAKLPGLMPRALALAGLYYTVPLLALPHVALDPVLMTVSTAVSLAGLIASLYALSWLGRSFSIFPQARGLVTAGPYRHVRHPLYLAELVASFGLMLQFAQPWALLIVLAGLAIQIGRIHYEEATLSQIYPAYAAYAGQTARLIPGLY